MRRPSVHGFTLVELIAVILIVSILAAVAMPKFLSFSQSARIAALESLAGTLRSTAENYRVLCKTNPECDYANPYQPYFTIQGTAVDLNYGWIDAGDTIGSHEIDTLVVYTGFTATVPTLDRTSFLLDSAPDPANCSVTYYDAYYRPSHDIAIVLTTGGC